MSFAVSVLVMQHKIRYVIMEIRLLAINIILQNSNVNKIHLMISLQSCPVKSVIMEMLQQFQLFMKKLIMLL